MSIFDPEDQTSVKSEINPDDKVDFEVLKQKIKQHGPLRVWLGELGGRVVIDIQPCGCRDESCMEDVITAKHAWGELPVKMTVDKDELCEADSLMDFVRDLAADPADQFTSLHERQQVEMHLSRLMQAGQFDIYAEDLHPEEVLTRLSQGPERVKDMPKANALLTLVGLLNQHGALDEAVR